MSVNESAFEYDVAFSFHSLDEGIATKLKDLLQDRFKIFLYSEQQKKLAGTDGEKKFNAVFGKEARLVVVLCRKEWGETAFTRIEETAIRNRAYKHGFDFTLFIPMEEPAFVPEWLPKTRLWFGLKRFGLDSAASVIELRVQEAGGAPLIETIADRAQRYKRSQELLTAQSYFQNSFEGTNEANAAFRKLHDAIRADVSAIASDPSGVSLDMVDIQGTIFIKGLGVYLHIIWNNPHTNALEYASLDIKIYDNVPPLPIYMTYTKANVIKSAVYTYHLFEVGRSGYVEKASKREFSPEELGAHILRQYMDTAQNFGRRR
jgi:hypothetical protein